MLGTFSGLGEGTLSEVHTFSPFNQPVEVAVPLAAQVQAMGFRAQVSGSGQR